MLQTIKFYVALFFLIIYYGSKVIFCKKEDRLESDEYNAKTWAKKLVKAGGMQVEADLSSITPGGHYVFIGNHQSNVDIPILMKVLDNHVIRFVAKESLFKIPVFGPAIRAVGHIPINRGNSREAMKSLNKAAKLAQAGVSPVIFPEGTRNTSMDELMSFKIGAVLLALKCGLPVVPIVLAGTGKYLPARKVGVNPEEIIKVKTLAPIDPGKYTLKDRNQFKDDIYEMMNSTYKEMMANR